MVYRLLGIIYILMNRGTVTAGELAERFEVSVRTIFRDVENLSLAGIPIYARKGKNGGICLTETFVLDKMLISGEEQRRILAALVSLRETGAEEEGEILRRLGDFFRMEPFDWVSIDFSDWSDRHRQLFLQIKEAILGRHVMTFDYYGQYGDMSRRTAEPLQLLFKEYTWYVRAYCRDRQAMRLFKVLRMKRVNVLEETFECKNVCHELPEPAPNEKQEKEAVSCQNMSTAIVMRIEGKEAYRVYDRFEEEEIRVLPSGDFEIRISCPLDDWVYGLILSFGPSAKVLEPEHVRKELGRRIARMAESYP